MFNARDIRIDNIKQICRRENSDGIDICNSRDVTVTGCFMRNNDDEICVKCTQPWPAQISKNIVVEGCVIWNERARGLGITSETRRDIEDVVFKNCDIIHDFSKAANAPRWPFWSRIPARCATSGSRISGSPTRNF